MKPRPNQFGVRENTASSRRHAPRLAVNSLPLPSDTLQGSSHHREPKPLLASRISEAPNLLTRKPLTTATGREDERRVDDGLDHGGQMESTRRALAFEPLLGSQDAARLLGNIHVKTLQRYARQGSVPGYRIAGHWYFRTTELDAWLRSRINSNRQSVR